MTTSELVFIPSPGAGHLPPTVELAKLLLHRDQRLSITIIILNFPHGVKSNTETPTTSVPGLRLIDIPIDESKNDHVKPKPFNFDYLENQKPHVRNIVSDITESHSVRLVGFVVDMFCVTMTAVATEFGVPTYLYFTSSAATLGLMFELQAKTDDEDFDVTELKDSDLELPLSSYANPVPAKVFPMVLFDKDGMSNTFIGLARKYREANGMSNTFIGLARKYREAKGILVNTFQELETHAMKSFLRSNANIPPVFPVGPILNLKNSTTDDKADEIMTWLNDQPESSVVFLCFGSMGSFSEEQVKEIAVAVEKSGQRFLWSLRCPPPKGMMGLPKEYDNFEEVLPEGFLERTSGVGKVIGWAPQIAVLSHPSVGGFVSHCGWNSTLESIWCGVPVAAWPLYAEQNLNAFQLVVELGLAAEIKIDYRSSMRPDSNEKEMIVTAAEIESGIRRLMSDEEMRKKVKEMSEKGRFAVSEGGSSHASIGRFIDNLIVE